jgi:hypothetical protein
MRDRILPVACVLSALLVPTGALLAAKPPQKGPGRVTIGVLPSTVTWGTTGGVGGQVSGRGQPTGSLVVLEAQTPPGAFVRRATDAADASGQYNFRVTPGVNTRYRVMAGAARVPSAEVLMFVRMRASLQVTDTSPASGQRVRFYGAVSPAHPGLVVRIQKRNPDGTFRNVAHTFLRAGSNASTSRYSGTIRVYRNGVYRVLVPTHNDHVKAFSGLRLLRIAS